MDARNNSREQKETEILQSTEREEEMPKRAREQEEDLEVSRREPIMDSKHRKSTDKDDGDEEEEPSVNRRSPISSVAVSGNGSHGEDARGNPHAERPVIPRYSRVSARSPPNRCPPQ